MTAINAVADGKLSNEEMGAFARRLDELKRRVNERTLPYQWAMDELQALIEGRGIPTWMKENGIISISVTSDGRSGEQFIETLPQANWRVSDYAKDVMRKPAFVSTTGQTYEFRAILGSEFDHDPTTAEIRALAKSRGYRTPPAEAAPLIREKLSDADLEKMGVLWLVIMHEPITVSDGDPYLLYVRRGDDGRWLNAYWDDPDHRWFRGGGWLFLAPQE